VTKYERGLREYNLVTLQSIAYALMENPDSFIPKTWESGRLEAIKTELKHRKKLMLTRKARA